MSPAQCVSAPARSTQRRSENLVALKGPAAGMGGTTIRKGGFPIAGAGSGRGLGPVSRSEAPFVISGFQDRHRDPGRQGAGGAQLRKASSTSRSVWRRIDQMMKKKIEKVTMNIGTMIAGRLKAVMRPSSLTKAAVPGSLFSIVVARM